MNTMRTVCEKHTYLRQHYPDQVIGYNLSRCYNQAPLYIRANVENLFFIANCSRH